MNEHHHTNEEIQQHYQRALLAAALRRVDETHEKAVKRINRRYRIQTAFTLVAILAWVAIMVILAGSLSN